MFRTITNILINKLGKSGYEIEKGFSNIDIIIILYTKFFEISRGLFLKFFLNKSTGFVFLGKHTRLNHCNNISAGKTLFIGDNVCINALSRNGMKIGNNVSILRNTIIECTGVIRDLGEGLEIGNNVGIAQNCFIQVRGKVSIGNDVILGPNVMIFSENHNFDDITIPIVQQGETRLPVTIENNVWLGARSVILGGVTVGEGSIVAAGAVVNKDVPPFSIVAGVPAKLIKSRLI